MTKRRGRPQHYPFKAEELAGWRSRGWSWPRIARKFGCDHTTVMYAAKRLGCYTPTRVRSSA